jgi:hypothetical protein
MDLTTALRDLGVTGDVLTQDEKDRLDRDGFLPLEGVLTLEEVSDSTSGWRSSPPPRATGPAWRCTRRTAPTGSPT